MEKISLNYIVDYITKQSINNVTQNRPTSFNNVGFTIPPKIFDLIGKYVADIHINSNIDKIMINGTTSNISIFSNILSCIKPNYQNLSKDNQIIYINRLLEKITKDINNIGKKIKNTNNRINFIEINLDFLGLPKQKILDAIKGNNNYIISGLLSEYFDINIFVFSLNEDKLCIIQSQPKINIYKPFVLLLKNEDIYYSISYKNSHIFYHNDNIIIDIINLSLTYDNTMIDFYNNSFKKLEIGDENLDKYTNIFCQQQKINMDPETIDQENGFNDHVDEGITNSEYEIEEIDTKYDIKSKENNIFCKKNIEIKINKNMKLDEIQKIATKLGIDLAHGKTKNGKPKMKTKNQLIDDIHKIID